MTEVLVTGANGFIGREVVALLVAGGYSVSAATRAPVNCFSGIRRGVVVGDLGQNTSWETALRGVEVVVHLAGAVPDKDRTTAQFQTVNVAATQKLALESARAGVRRLVFISSAKVNGEVSSRPLVETDPVSPRDDYSRSKWSAEQTLASVSKATGLEVVVLRPPLVYGSNVKGNFARLVRAVNSGLPLPFAEVNARRSFIYTGNLADAIARCIDSVEAAGQTYFVSDGQDPSTPELLRCIALALGRSVRLWRMSKFPLAALSTLLGRRGLLDRMMESFQVDSSKFRRELIWRPPFSFEEGVARTVAEYHGDERV